MFLNLFLLYVMRAQSSFFSVLKILLHVIRREILFLYVVML